MAGRNSSLRALVQAAMAGCALLGFAAGCSTVPPPPAAKFFDRHSIEGTLKGFVYAVDAHQWEYAHASLTKSSQEEISLLRLEVALRFLKDPRVDVPLFDLISNALERRTEPTYTQGGEAAVVTVMTKGRDPNGTLVLVMAEIWFRREDGDWQLDLLRSLGVAPGQGEPAEGPRATDLSRL